MRITLILGSMFFILLFAFGNMSLMTIPNSTENRVSPKDLEMLIGEWTGTLTYLDYTSKKPYTMPANLEVKPGKNQNQLVLFNIFPNEPKANNKYKIVLTKDVQLLNKKKVTCRQTLSNGNIQIVTEFEGKDNNKKASIRKIYTFGEKQFAIRKEVQFEDNPEWIMRNEFSYVRK